MTYAPMPLPACAWCGETVFPDESVLAVRSADQRWFHLPCARLALAEFRRDPQAPPQQVEP